MALAKLGRYNDHVVALDGDTKNSTFSELFKNEHPNRYVECYIAEQNMVRKRLSRSNQMPGEVWDHSDLRLINTIRAFGSYILTIYLIPG